MTFKKMKFESDHFFFLHSSIAHRTSLAPVVLSPPNQRPTGSQGGLMRSVHRWLIFLAFIVVASSAFAQTTATLNGSVTSEGKPLPGVTVTAASPNLQGTRTTVSGETGAYVFSGLPPGDYTVSFELEGM